MGAGILPTTIHNNKLFFLFGKENKYEDSAPGFSDFGGGTDNNETYFETAIREAGEELTGFLGNDNEQDVLNTQLMVVNRFLEVLRRGDLAEDYELVGTPSVEFFTERFENKLAGVTVTFEMAIANQMGIC